MTYGIYLSGVFTLVGCLTLVGSRFLPRPQRWKQISADVTSIDCDAESQLSVNYSFRLHACLDDRPCNETKIYTGSGNLSEAFHLFMTRKARQARIDELLATKFDVWYAEDDPSINQLEKPSNFGRCLSIVLGYAFGLSLLIFGLNGLLPA